MLETHLMISDPEKYIEAFAQAGTDLITVHYESTPHILRAIQQIRDLKKQPGVTINPGTPLHVLDEVLSEIDLVLLMTVNPGFGNQKLIPSMIEKIARLAYLKAQRQLNFEIEVDGGVNATTLKTIVNAGAEVLVAGSAIFNASEGIIAAMQKFKELVSQLNQVQV